MFHSHNCNECFAGSRWQIDNCVLFDTHFQQFILVSATDEVLGLDNQLRNDCFIHKFGWNNINN